MSNILKGIQLNEADPRNFDSDVDYYAARNAPAKARSHNRPSPGVNPDDEDYFREIFRKKREAAKKAEQDKEQGVAKGSLNEFAHNAGGEGGNYLKALASAWYNHDIDMLKDIIKQGGNALNRIIDAQEAVEKILARGIHCGDGKVRKYMIGYNHRFDGVDIQSDDHYEYADYDDAGRDIDSRTGKPWGPYDVVAFGSNELDESIQQGVAEGKEVDISVVVGKLYDIIDHTENEIKNADYDRQVQYATTVRDRAVKALEMIKQGGNTSEAASAAFKYMQTGEQGVVEASFDYTMKDLGNDYAGFPSNHSLKHKFLAKIKPEKQQLYKDKMNNMHEFDQLFQLFNVAKQRGDIIDQGVTEMDGDNAGRSGGAFGKEHTGKIMKAKDAVKHAAKWLTEPQGPQQELVRNRAKNIADIRKNKEQGVAEGSLNEFAPDEGGGSRKFIPWPEFIDAVKQIVGKDFNVTEKVIKSTIQDRFVPHDPMEFGPTMLYSYYEARAGRGKGAVSTRGSIQVGKYYPNSTQLGTRNFITSFNLLKGHPFERHFDLTFDNIYKIANIIMGNTEGAYQMPQQQGVAEEKEKGADGKACWDGYRYNGTEDGKDSCVKVSESLDYNKRQQLIRFLAKKMDWEVSYLELASDANLISWYKKVQSGKDPMKESQKEADYGDEYQSMVARVGQKAKEQEKKKPVDIQALARRLNQPEKKSSILKGIEENLGTPYPSTYEEENKPFMKKGSYRITAMTSENKK